MSQLYNAQIIINNYSFFESRFSLVGRFDTQEWYFVLNNRFKQLFCFLQRKTAAKIHAYKHRFTGILGHCNQSRDFTVLSDSYTIRWRDNKTTLLPNQYLFMVMCINKVTDLPIYSYKNKLGGWNVVKEKHIRLPQKNDKIDLGLMDSFISAMKKLTIKDVALYADRKIEATKTIVSSKSVE